MAEGNGILSAIELFDLGFLSIPVKNVKNEMRVVTGHRAKELTHPFFLLDEFRDFYHQEPDAWAAVCGYKGLQGYLVYIDAEENKIADAARAKIIHRFGSHYREEFGSKGAHFPIIVTDAPVEKRTEFFNGATTSDNLVMEVLTDWLCILPGSKHRKTGAEYSLKHAGAIPKMKKQELSEMLAEIEKENKLSHRQKNSDAPTTVDEEIAEIKIKCTFFDLNLKPGLQSCPLAGHKHNDASPSLSVSTDGRVANCFSVHAGMDVFRFIMLRDNCDFPTAKRLLLNLPNAPRWSGAFSNDDRARNAPNEPTKIASKTHQRTSLYTGALVTGALRKLEILTFPSITLDMLKDPEYVVDKYIGKATTNVLGGKSEAFKSAVGFYMLSKVAVGGTVWGGIKCVEGAVWWIDEDEGRFKTLDYVQKVRNNLTDGEKAKFDKNFFFSTSQGLRLDDDFKTIEEFIVKNRPVLVAVDAFVATHGADENNSTEIRTLFKTVLQELSEKYGVSWLLLHHNRKTIGLQNKNNDSDDDIDRMRGSGDIAALCTGCFYLRRLSPDSEEVVFKVIKNRWGSKSAPRRLFMHFDDEKKTLEIEDGGEATPELAKDAERSEKIIEWITEKRPLETSTSEICDRFGKDGTTQRSIKLLKEKKIFLNARSPFKINYALLARQGDLGEGATV
jgi:hypothetical protein